MNVVIRFPDDIQRAEVAWEELKAAVIVRFRVNTPEVSAEIVRAKRALLEALGEVDTS